MLSQILLSGFFILNQAEPSEKLGVYLCDLFVVGTEGKHHYLKESPLFKYDLTNPISFPPVTVGSKTAEDFEGDIQFPGKVYYRFLSNDPGSNVSGFELPGTALSFMDVMYSHNSVGAKAAGTSSIFSLAVVSAQINSETLQEVGFVCSPFKDN
jgi:hypothetical protein